MRRVLLAALLPAVPLLAAPPAQADESLVISSVTVEDVPRDTDSPYLPAEQALAVAFADPTPSDPVTYQLHVQVNEEGTLFFDDVVEDRGPERGLVGLVAHPFFRDGDRLSITVLEVRADGTSTSAPAETTYATVEHPDRLTTSARTRDGVRSLDVAKPLELTFRDGEWEEGTRFDTRVFVSDRARFTGQDLARNLDGGALVASYDTDRPVLRVPLSEDLLGKYLWVSVVGRKDGEVGRGFAERPVKVVFVKERWRLKRLTHRRDTQCAPEHTEAMRLIGGGGRHVFLMEQWGRGPWRKAMRQTTLPSGRFDLANYAPKQLKRYRTKIWDVSNPSGSGPTTWNQRMVVPGDETHERYLGSICTFVLNGRASPGTGARSGPPAAGVG